MQVRKQVPTFTNLTSRYLSASFWNGICRPCSTWQQQSRLGLHHAAQANRASVITLHTQLRLTLHGLHQVKPASSTTGLASAFRMSSSSSSPSISFTWSGHADRQ